jgi:hypothetical protein
MIFFFVLFLAEKVKRAPKMLWAFPAAGKKKTF